VGLGAKRVTTVMGPRGSVLPSGGRACYQGGSAVRSLRHRLRLTRQICLAWQAPIDFRSLKKGG